MYVYIVINNILITIVLCLKLISIEHIIQKNIDSKQERIQRKEQQERETSIRENSCIKEISFISLESVCNKEFPTSHSYYREKERTTLHV